jgi:hypothetical protein
MAALAGGHTNFIQIKGMTTHAAGDISKGGASSVTLSGEALKVVKD